jgi:hypothetical protein
LFGKTDIRYVQLEAIDDTLSQQEFLENKVQQMMENIFDGIIDRILKLISTPTVKGNGNECDGMEAMAMLSILKEYSELVDKLSVYRDDNIISSSTATANATTVVRGNNNNNNNSMDSNENNMQNNNNNLIYVRKFLQQLMEKYDGIVRHYTQLQVNWINNQKGDPKSPGILPSFYKFPTLVQQILEMSNNMMFPCIDDLLPILAKELFLWLNTFARQNEKYTDKIKIANLSFFRLSMSRWSVSVLQSFLASATQQIEDSTIRYINWMVEYEFPALSALAIRMDGVGNRVSDEGLSVYIRRKDVLNVIKELEQKAIDVVINNLRKRLEKHFQSEFDLVSYISMRLYCYVIIWHTV